MMNWFKGLIHRAPPLYRFINRLRGRLLHRVELDIPLTRLGSDYGGWELDTSSLTSGSVVYSVGIGEDISFDLALMSATGCTVQAFDPTPIAVDWIGRQVLPENFRFHAVGLSHADELVEFHLPPVSGWHSFSLTPDPQAAVRGTVQCPVKRLSTIAREMHHDHIDLLKMDIEGFEYPVISDICAGTLFPAVILVEFHHDVYGLTKAMTIQAASELQEAGYRIFWISDTGREYGFVRPTALTEAA